MYEILVEEEKIIRHVDQIRKSHKVDAWSFNAGSNENDWAPNAGSLKADERRYPIRDRRKPARYGIDE